MIQLEQELTPSSLTPLPADQYHRPNQGKLLTQNLYYVNAIPPTHPDHCPNEGKLLKQNFHANAINVQNTPIAPFNYISTVSKKIQPIT